MRSGRGYESFCMHQTKSLGLVTSSTTSRRQFLRRSEALSLNGIAFNREPIGPRGPDKRGAMPARLN